MPSEGFHPMGKEEQEDLSNPCHHHGPLQPLLPRTFTVFTNPEPRWWSCPGSFPRVSFPVLELSLWWDLSGTQVAAGPHSRGLGCHRASPPVGIRAASALCPSPWGLSELGSMHLLLCHHGTMQLLLCAPPPGSSVGTLTLCHQTVQLLLCAPSLPPQLGHLCALLSLGFAAAASCPLLTPLNTNHCRGTQTPVPWVMYPHLHLRYWLHHRSKWACVPGHRGHDSSACHWACDSCSALNASASGLVPQRDPLSWNIPRHIEEKKRRTPAALAAAAIAGTHGMLAVSAAKCSHGLCQHWTQLADLHGDGASAPLPSWYPHSQL